VKRDRKDVEGIVKYCDEKCVTLHVAAGNSGVMRGKEAVKGPFESHNIMNPGGTLGLDMTDEQKRKLRGFVD
jgi:hypothetical protein